MRHILPTSAAAGSHISNPLLLKAQCRQLLIGLQQSHCTTESTIVANDGDHNSMTKPSASLHETGLFSEDVTKGWARCNRNAELVERAATLGKRKLLVGSGCLEFQKGMAGMDS